METGLEVIIKHNNDLYAGARDSEYETPIFDNGQHEPDSDNSPEVTVSHDLLTDETCTIPGTLQEDSPEILPHRDEIGDGTGTDHYMEPDAEVDVEPFSPSNTNPAAQNMIYATILNQNAMTTTDIKLQICLAMVPETTTYTIRVSCKTATERLRSTYIPTHKLLLSLLEQHRITSK